FTAQDDSVQINIITNNYGLAEEDSFAIQITQRLPDGRLFEHPIQKERLIRYRDTLSYILKNPAGNAVTGQNFFDVFVDAYDSIPELNENNNRVRIDRLIPGNIPAILFPYEYAIVESPQISLQASAFFMTRDDNVGYFFEIDTTQNFNSPLRARSGLINGNATFVEWDVPFSLQDSAVYYWRVRLADVTPISWGVSSFKYISGETGWAQSRLDQFNKARLNTVSINTNQQEWEFGSFGTEYEFVVDEKREFSYSINGSLAVNVALNGWFTNSVAYLVIDQFDLQVKNSLGGLYEVGISQANEGHFKLRQAIEAANDGDYIVVGSHLNPEIPLWNEETFQALEKIGVSDNIRLLGDNEQFVVMGRKGYPNSAIEVFSPNVGPIMVINNLMLSNYDEGFATSTRIGPSLAWDRLFWGWDSKDVIVQELSEVDVYAVRYDGTDSLVFSNLAEGDYDISSVDAEAFPFMRLKAHLQDTITRTAPQLDNWHVTYTPPPDAVVDLITDFTFRSDTIFEGEDIFLKMGARNISSTDMDSVRVRFTLEREDRSRLVLDSFMIAPLLANGNRVPFEYSFNTLNRELEGDVLLLVEVNPGGEQIELHEFNNLYIQHFFVKTDRINPIMDVTFDGKHIIDGDIVAPRPEILIEVNDENEFVAITDTAAFELYFKPGDNAAVPYERIFVQGDPRVEWEPGELPDNKARLYFRPGLQDPLPDGAYQLRVQGKDQNGNAAGRGESFYEIRFEVENKSTMSQVLNYPNPFSTSTRFVFTLTGSEVPEVFQIQIYTISGKMVRNIDLKELGDVHIGRNITRFAWDGTDEYGDRLANGVYLYRVVTQMSSQTLEKRDEGIDDFFNNGWGKMYLMR
ncbi:MAG: FlgD immunoglobulin-like domain containing protein, partial [Bacteroidota bacterium]